MRGYKTPPRFPARESNLASDNKLVTSANDKGDGRMNRRGRRAVSTRLRNGSRVKGGRNERGRVAVPSISAPIIQRASDPSNPKFHSVSPNSSNSNSLFDRFHSLFTCKFYTFHILCQYAYSKAIIGDKRVTRIIRFESGNDRHRFINYRSTSLFVCKKNACYRIFLYVCQSDSFETASFCFDL